MIIHCVRVNSHMHTTTNYFIVNMAVADIIVTISSIPFITKIVLVGLAWFKVLGSISCKFNITCQFTIVFCSIFSLVVITIDRYMAVSRPLKYQSNRPSTRYLIFLTWVLAIYRVSLCSFN